MKNSRRKFMRKIVAVGAASFSLHGNEIFAFKTNNQDSFKMKNGMVILFQGDSITDGNRGRNNDLNHIMGHGYAYTIASRLGADFPGKNLFFYNRGISGNNVVDLAERWNTDTLELKADVISILVGVNDSSSVVFQNEPVITVERYEQVYKSLLGNTLAEYPEMIFVLCEPFILKVGKVKDNWEAYYSDIIRRQQVVRKLAAQYNAIFVEFQQVFDKACSKASAEYWIWDGIHPTVAGHELMGREWIKQVDKKIPF